MKTLEIKNKRNLEKRITKFINEAIGYMKKGFFYIAVERLTKYDKEKCMYYTCGYELQFVDTDEVPTFWNAEKIFCKIHIYGVDEKEGLNEYAIENTDSEIISEKKLKENIVNYLLER